jgi:hypothetical protein
VEDGPDFTDAPDVYGIDQMPDGRLLIVGRVGGETGAAAAWTSVDGATWERPPGLGAPDGSVAYAATHAATLETMVGASDDGSGAVWGSDGADWSRTATLEGVMYDVDRTSGGVVGVGVDGPAAVAWTSEDPTAWTPVVLAPAGRAVHVVVGPDGRVVVSGALTDADDIATPVVWSSVDGMTWTQTVLPTLVPGHWSNPSAAATPAGYVELFADLARDDKAGHVLVSRDGLSWTETLVTEAGPSLAAGSLDTDALLIGDGRVITSPDATSWSTSPEPAFDGWPVRAVMRISDGRLFAAGYVFGSAMATWTGTPIEAPA